MRVAAIEDQGSQSPEWPPWCWIHPILGNPQRPAGFIDDLCLRKHKYGPRAALLKSLQTTPHQGGMKLIIVRGPLEKRTVPELEYAVVVALCPDVSCVPVIPDSGILGGEPLANVGRPIIGSIV